MARGAVSIRDDPRRMQRLTRGCDLLFESMDTSGDGAVDRAELVRAPLSVSLGISLSLS